MQRTPHLPKKAFAPLRLPSPHRSSLSNALYYFSFAGRAHGRPMVLYAIGTVSAMVAGACIPAIDILFGYWSDAVTLGADETVDSRSRLAAAATALIGVVSLLTSFLFSVSCTCRDCRATSW